jgi:hypothetical protein
MYIYIILSIYIYILFVDNMICRQYGYVMIHLWKSRCWISGFGSDDPQESEGVDLRQNYFSILSAVLEQPGSSELDGWDGGLESNGDFWWFTIW